MDTVAHETKVKDLRPGQCGWATPWTLDEGKLRPNYLVHPDPRDTVSMLVGRNSRGRYYARPKGSSYHQVVALEDGAPPSPDTHGLQSDDLAWLHGQGWDGTYSYPTQRRRSTMSTLIVSNPPAKKAVIAATRTGSVALLVLLLFLSTLPWWGAAITALLVHATSLLVAGFVYGRATREVTHG